MTVIVGPGLAVALGLFLALSVVASRLGGLGLAKAQAVAAVRAVAQLAVVSGVITLAVQSLWSSLAFTGLMFAIAVWTTTGRAGVRPDWPWTAVAMLAGILPVLLIVFLTGAAPLNGITLVSLGGIITGNMMTVHTLAGRRVFAELRANQPEYEGALSIGLPRTDAIGLIVQRVVPEALIPNLDQTRTVGLVTLPGAFVGVLLGGGSPVQAGASQLLVLLGVMAGQAITVVVMTALVRAGRLVPADLRLRLHP